MRTRSQAAGECDECDSYTTNQVVDGCLLCDRCRAMSAHLCHARGCEMPVPPRMFMCRRHWFMLPKVTRDRVWAAYRPGQEITKDPSGEYMDVTTAAIAWLDAIEHDRLDVP